MQRRSRRPILTVSIVLAAAAMLAALAPGARAARGTVALMPGHVYQGDRENGPVIMAALRESLEREGFRLLPEAKVENAIHAQGLNLSMPLSLMKIHRLREATGADWVIYPRILGVGMGIKAVRPQANVMVNVLGASTRAYAHSWQVGYEFDAREDPETGGALIIDRSSADAAVARLMKGFYERVK